MLDREKAAGLQELSGYTEFSARVAKVRRDLLRFLIEAAERGKTVVGYGAPGKGNTLLNHCGIRPDLLPYTVDRNPYKHGRFTPGTRIPILPPEQIAADGRTTSSSCRGTCGTSWSSSCPSCTPGAAGWSSPSRN